MTRRWLAGLLLALDIPVAAALAAVIATMILEYVELRREAPRAAAAVAELERRVQQDAAAAEELHALRKRLADESLERERRRAAQSLQIAALAAAFLVLTRSALLLLPRPAPSLERVRREKERIEARRKRPKRRRAGTPGANGRPHPPGTDLAFVDQVVRELGRSSEAAIPILQRIQQHYRYLPDQALERVCQLTEITPAQITGVATFYSQFRRSPVGRHIIRVCHGTACHVSGAREITQELRRHLQIPDGGDTDPQRLFTVDEVACLGCCSLAPVIMIDETTAGRLTPRTACEAVEDYRVEQAG